jgi:hypothetical protein
MHQKDNAIVGRTEAVCALCVFWIEGAYLLLPQSSFFLILPFLSKRTKALFAGAPRATVIVMKFVFIISTALECIVISVSATNFFWCGGTGTTEIHGFRWIYAEKPDQSKVKVMFWDWEEDNFPYPAIGSFCQLSFSSTLLLLYTKDRVHFKALEDITTDSIESYEFSSQNKVVQW